MKKLIQLSRLFQIIVLLAFFLPFYPQGCSDSPAQEKEQYRIDSLRMDSIMRADSEKYIDSILHIHPNANIDSLFNNWDKGKAIKDSLNNLKRMFDLKMAKEDSIAAIKDSIASKDTASSHESVKGSIAERLSGKSKIVKALLLPNNQYSGVGFIVDNILAYLFYGGTFIAFLLLIIGLIIKYQNFNFIFHLLNIIAIISLLFTNPINVDSFDLIEDKLWGYWVCLILGLILIIYDSVILVIKRRNKDKELAYKL